MFIDTRQTATVAIAQPLPGKDGSAPAYDLAYLVKVLWNRQGTIYVAVILCVAAALAFGHFVPARFTASVQVLIDPNDLRVVENGLRGQNQLTETHVTQVENQVRILVSNNVVRRVVERLKLDHDPEFLRPASPDFRAAFRELFGLRQPAGRGDPTLDALNALKDRIRSKRVDRTYVVDASVWAYSPQKAVELANALLESFLEEQSAARGEAARRASGSLNARLAELRERVQEAEQRVEDYKRANGIVSSSGTLVNERQVTELNSQLVLARTKSAEAKSRYDRIREIQRSRTDPSAIGEVVGSATITALRTQLAEILRREGEVHATLGKRHPAVIEIDSQVRRIRLLIDEEVTRIGEAARNDMERAVANEATLAANLDKLKAGLEDTNDASVRLRELERDVQASRSVYEAYLVRTRELSEQERLDTNNVRVIAPPELPEHRSFPPRNVILLLAGGMLGGLLGAGFAFLGEWRARRAPAMPKPADVPAATVVPPPPDIYAPPAYAPPAPPPPDLYAPPAPPPYEPYAPPAPRAATPVAPPAHGTYAAPAPRAALPPTPPLPPQRAMHHPQHAAAMHHVPPPPPRAPVAPAPPRTSPPAPPSDRRLHAYNGQPGHVGRSMSSTRVRSKGSFKL